LTKKVSERNLEDFFSQIGKVRSVIMLRDKFTGQHKGFAYVEMAELEAVPNCLLFNNVVPDFQKFPILVKASEAEKNYLAKKDALGASAVPPLGPSGGASSGEGSMQTAGQDTRVYVGNIHISIDEVALRAVLEQFGPIESLKLNRDSMGNSKGYAFVKYVSYESTKLAMTALPSIELMGRYLRVGNVTDHTNRADPLNIVASLTDQQSNWKLDADDNGQGVAMDSTRRQQLMAKLGEKAGISVPVPVLPTVPQHVNGAMSMPALSSKATVPPVAGTPSRCVRIMNMFNPETETQPRWDEEIKEDVVDQCANFGRVEHCYVDTRNPVGYVYFRMLTTDAAQKAAENLNGRFFAGRMITATYLDEVTYAQLAI
jgi:RNA-binding protein 39